MAQDKAYNFEIYTCDEVTGETGWNIHYVSVVADSKSSAKEKLKEYPHFDCVILFNYCVPIEEDREEFCLDIVPDLFWRTKLKPVDTTDGEIRVEKEREYSSYLKVQYNDDSCRLLARLTHKDDGVSVYYEDTMTEIYLNENAQYVEKAIKWTNANTTVMN